MARRKGKSRRRIKNWQQHLSEEQDVEQAGPKRQSLSQRAVKIPPHRLEAPEENLEELVKADGMVMGFYPGGAVVRVDKQALLCGIAKTYRAAGGASPLAVGDDVTVGLTQLADDSAESDRHRADGLIIARRERRTVLARPQPVSGKRQDGYKSQTFHKVIAANMDLLLIVVAVRSPKLRPGLIDRFLIIAERGELTPLVVINKIDEARPDKALLADLRNRDLETLLTSATTGRGVGALRKRLRAARSVLAGPSGAGKSALINAMIPGAGAATRPMRKKDRRGRHTTSAAVVYDLAGGGLIVDTPGIRELGMDLTAEELPWYFPEFEQHARGCRFNNCTHTHEPDCAIRAAVEADAIPHRRYDSYLRILETL